MRPRFSENSPLGKVLIVTAFGAVLGMHCVVQFLTYRTWGRADLFTAGLPAAAAWAAYTGLISRARGKRFNQSLAGGIVTTLISCWLALLIPINTFGS